MLRPGHAIGRELLRVFGLEGQKVRRLVLDVPADGVPVLYVERYPDAEQVVAAAGVVADAVEVIDLNGRALSLDAPAPSAVVTAREGGR